MALVKDDANSEMTRLRSVSTFSPGDSGEVSVELSGMPSPKTGAVGSAVYSLRGDLGGVVSGDAAAWKPCISLYFMGQAASMMSLTVRGVTPYQTTHEMPGLLSMHTFEHCAVMCTWDGGCVLGDAGPEAASDATSMNPSARPGSAVRQAHVSVLAPSASTTEGLMLSCTLSTVDDEGDGRSKLSPGDANRRADGTQATSVPECRRIVAKLLVRA